MVSSMPWLCFTPRKDRVPIVQEAEWAPGLVWKGGKSRSTRIRSPDRPACIQSLYRMSYLAHKTKPMSVTQIPFHDINWITETLLGVPQTGPLKMRNYPQVTKVNLMLKQDYIKYIYYISTTVSNQWLTMNVHSYKYSYKRGFTDTKANHILFNHF